MPRVKRGVTAHARHKKIIDQAKGYRGRRKPYKQSLKQVNMLTEIVVSEKDNFVPFGLRESMLLPVFMDYHIAVS